MLGFHCRRVRRWEWETDMPKPGPLLQTSQTEDTRFSVAGEISETCRR